ncbi:PHP domain-containing protein [Brachybacterium sp. AOP25-B2-12]|uniref:PHP domain-containing protein n=1 Tax=Brachybacterium sp. AOP25-B2-12 TaxID=3457710 RepID=UPI00403429D1
MPTTSDDARIDLHTHSRYSDGTSTVDELLGAARATGLDVIALTDHDTIAGWDDARALCSRHGVAVVPGIEVSTEYGRSSVHVLAFLPDPSPDTELAVELARSREARIHRAERMVERIAADLPLTWEQVLAQVAGEQTTVGRPHIADALVAAGLVGDRDEAFATILADGSPYYVGHYAPSPHVAVAAIRAAGGVPVIAHPASGTRGVDVPLALLEELVAAGLQGVEVDHREHDHLERERLRSFAHSHDLLITGGSDYHGRGKPNRLGENLTSPHVLDAIIERAGTPTRRTEVIRP